MYWLPFLVFKYNEHAAFHKCNEFSRVNKKKFFFHFAGKKNKRDRVSFQMVMTF